MTAQKRFLPDNWTEKIFQILLGTYGAQFRAKYSQVIKDHVLNVDRDVGMEMAKKAWSKELAGFDERPECIAYALDNLPSARAPNAIEFRDLCRKAPKKEAPQIDYKPTAEDLEKAKEFARKAEKIMRQPDRDDLECWKRPRSQFVADNLFDAKKKARAYPSLARIFDQLVKDGRITESGKLLYRWDGAAWLKI